MYKYNDAVYYWNSVATKAFHSIHVCLYNYYCTAPKHYTSIFNENYYPGDPIEVQTAENNDLEGSRQFEVRMTDPVSNPLNIIEPNHVKVTIRDNDGM